MLQIGTGLGITHATRPSGLVLPVTSGLVAWYSADNITGLSNGDPVGTWADRSGLGNNLTQATQSKKPTYLTGQQNGLPGVQADTVDDAMASPSITLSAQPFTIFAVFRPDTIQSGNNVRLWGFFGTVTGRFQISSGTPNLLFVVGSFTVIGAALAAGSTYIAIATYDGANLSLSLNGTVTTGAGAGAQISSSPIAFGTANPVGTTFFEQGGYTTGLSAADVVKLKNYFAAKWGVAVS